jgi:hypothetical protein
MKHGLPVPEHTGTAAQMTHPSFLRRYESLFCISGTFGDQVDRQHVHGLYNLVGCDIPSHHPSQHADMGLCILEDPAACDAALMSRVTNLRQTGRPILIFVHTIEETDRLADMLVDHGIEYQVLNDRNNRNASGEPASEEAIIDAGGKSGMVTIATSVAGRGADIILDDASRTAGGLHTILTFIPQTVRVETQNRKRAARQGDPGSSEILTNFETDPFIRQLAPYVRERVERLASEYGADSHEARQGIEFTRQAINHIYAPWILFQLSMDGLQQDAMFAHFEMITQYADALASANSHMRDMGGTHFARHILLSEMGALWAREFDLLQLTIMDFMQFESPETPPEPRVSGDLIKAHFDVFGDEVDTVVGQVGSELLKFAGMRLAVTHEAIEAKDVPTIEAYTAEMHARLETHIQAILEEYSSQGAEELRLRFSPLRGLM